MSIDLHCRPLREQPAEHLLAGVLGEASLHGNRVLLARAGGLPRLARLTPRQLQRELCREGPIDGWPDDGALRVCCALELGRRAVGVELPTGRVVRSARDLEPYLRGVLAGLPREVFVVVLLDAKNRPFRSEQVSEGCLTWAVVHPREVFGPAVREGAGSVVVAHNHPSGDPTPSRQDVEVSTRLLRVGELLGIPLLDHVVVGARRCLSLRAEGLLDESRASDLVAGLE